MFVRRGTRKSGSPALLACENPEGSCGQWVRHTFDSVRVTAEDGTTEELYRCSSCGALRRWGLLCEGEKKASKAQGKQAGE